MTVQTVGRADEHFQTAPWPHLQRVAFVNGFAGTGKSFCIRRCTAWCRPNDVQDLVTASTGCATALLGRTTVPAAAGIGGGDDDIHGTLTLHKSRGVVLAETKVVFIDGMSFREGHEREPRSRRRTHRRSK